TVNGEVGFRVDGTELVNRFAKYIHHPAERCTADGYPDRIARVHSFHAANHAFGGLHGHGANAAFAKVLLNFHGDVERLGKIVTFAGDANCVEDCGQLALVKLNVEHGSDDLDHTADSWFVLCHCFSLRAVRGAAHNFDNFFGDGRLTDLVHV